MQRFLNIFIFTDPLHCSGGFSAHHQEHIPCCCRGGNGTSAIFWRRWHQCYLLHGSS